MSHSAQVLVPVNPVDKSVAGAVHNRTALCYSGFPDFVRLLARKRGPGMCDKCGKRSDLYAICQSCAELEKIGRALRAGRKDGDLVSERRPGHRGLFWSATEKVPKRRLTEKEYKRLAEQLRKRGKPRIGGKAIDPEELIARALNELAKPSTEEEIVTQMALMRWRTPKFPSLPHPAPATPGEP